MTEQSSTVTTPNGYDSEGRQVKKRSLVFAQDAPVRPAADQSAAGENPGALAKLFTGKERDSETGLDYFGAR